MWLQAECRAFTHKKMTITRANLMKLAEAAKRIEEEAHPENYSEHLPSLNYHLTRMLQSGKYVFSADFLARGYRFDRLAAEKMWRCCCIPEEITEQDVATCVFTGNPPMLGDGHDEEAGIWEPPPPGEVFGSHIDVEACSVIESSSDDDTQH